MSVDVEQLARVWGKMHDKCDELRATYEETDDAVRKPRLLSVPRYSVR